MKKNLVYIIVLLVLGGIALYFAITNNSYTIKKELRDFAVEDTASVDKIFMVRKTNEHVTLSRENGVWMVNQKYEARKDAVDLVLKTLHRLKVKSPVSKTAFDNIVKNMASRNTKLEVYQKGKLVKTIYIGGPTQDQTGTFMMLDKSSTPFVVHIPGFTGYLSSRFFVDEHLWRSTSLFKYDFEDIKSIQVEVPDAPSQSFKIESPGNNQFEIYRISNQEKPPQTDTLLIKSYISMFERLNFESIVAGLPQEEKDSVLNSPPKWRLQVEDRNGEKTLLETWLIAAKEGETDPEGNEIDYDPDRMFGLVNKEIFVTVQYYVFDPVLKEFSFFLPPE